MTKGSYIKAVSRKLKCSGNRKNDIKKQLESDIQAALESGETMEQIIERMGTPESTAEEFNDNFSEKEIKAAVRTKRLKIIAIVVIAAAALIGGIYWCLPKSYEIGGDFKEDEVKERTELVVGLLDAHDYEELKQYSIPQIQTAIEDGTIDGVKAQISKDWGEFQSFGNMYAVEVKQMSLKLAVVQVNAVYENVAVTYTISFDEDLKLAGLFMK